MSRAELIRRHYEAVRDLTWAEELLPKFQRHGVNPEMLENYREAWNRSAEKRDWAWWQEEAKGHSNERLQDMLMDCIERLDAIGMPQWRRENSRGEQIKLKQMLENTSETKSAPREQLKTRGRDHER